MQLLECYLAYLVEQGGNPVLPDEFVCPGPPPPPPTPPPPDGPPGGGTPGGTPPGGGTPPEEEPPDPPQPPVAEAGGPYGGDVGQVIQFNGSGTIDPDTPTSNLVFNWNYGDGGGSGNIVGNPFTSHAYSAPGNFTCTLTVTDNTQLSDTDTAPVVINALPAPPVADAGGPYVANITIPVVVSGTGSTWSPIYTPSQIQVRWQWDDGLPDTVGTAATHLTPSQVYDTPGNKNITLTLTDPLQRTSSDIATVSVLTPVPTVADANGPYLTYVQEPIELNGTGSTWATLIWIDSQIQVKWNFGDGSVEHLGTMLDSATVEHTYTSAGTKTVTLTLTDPLGRIAVDTATVDVFATIKPPVAEANGPYLGTVGVPLSVSASGTEWAEVFDPASISLNWSWGDNTPDSPGNAITHFNTSHTYASAGPYTITLTILDPQFNSDSDTAAVTIELVSSGNNAPIASFSGPTSVLVGEEGEWSAQNTTDPVFAGGSCNFRNDLLTYRWDWGDGSPIEQGLGQTHYIWRHFDYTDFSSGFDFGGYDGFVVNRAAVDPPNSTADNAIIAAINSGKYGFFYYNTFDFPHSATYISGNWFNWLRNNIQFGGPVARILRLRGGNTVVGLVRFFANCITGHERELIDWSKVTPSWQDTIIAEMRTTANVLSTSTGLFIDAANTIPHDSLICDTTVGNTPSGPGCLNTSPCGSAHGAAPETAPLYDGATVAEIGNSHATYTNNIMSFFQKANNACMTQSRWCLKNVEPRNGGETIPKPIFLENSNVLRPGDPAGPLSQLMVNHWRLHDQNVLEVKIVPAGYSPLSNVADHPSFYALRDLFAAEGGWVGVNPIAGGAFPAEGSNGANMMAAYNLLNAAKYAAGYPGDNDSPGYKFRRHTYTAAGTYTITLRVTEPAPCNLFHEITRTVNVSEIQQGNPGAPIADITGPSQVNVNQSNTYSAMASIDTGVPATPQDQMSYTYAWGDGTTDGPLLGIRTRNHTYTTNNIVRIITLTVNDNHPTDPRTDTDTHSVTVGTPPAPTGVCGNDPGNQCGEPEAHGGPGLRGGAAWTNWCIKSNFTPGGAYDHLATGSDGAMLLGAKGEAGRSEIMTCRPYEIGGGCPGTEGSNWCYIDFDIKLDPFWAGITPGGGGHFFKYGRAPLQCHDCSLSQNCLRFDWGPANTASDPHSLANGFACLVYSVKNGVLTSDGNSWVLRDQSVVPDIINTSTYTRVRIENRYEPSIGRLTCTVIYRFGGANPITRTQTKTRSEWANIPYSVGNNWYFGNFDAPTEPATGYIHMKNMNFGRKD